MDDHTPQDSHSTSGQSSDALNPGIIFDTLNAHQKSAALRGAIELDLFSQIANGHATAEALAEKCRAAVRAMRILCDFLTVHGFLTKQDGQYGLTPPSAEFLDRASPKYMGSIARFINSPDQLDAVRDVAELVRRGTTLLNDQGTTSQEYEGWVDFARCMAPMMAPAAAFLGELAAGWNNGPIRVLDIAAGHGLFGLSIAQRNPQAEIVALDWGPVLEVAAENAAQAGLQDRYTLMPGDALQIDYGSGFDLVLLTNFLHHFDQPTCVGVMQKIAACLNDEGRVFTLEFVPDEDRISPPPAATFAFTMLASTPAGDAYTLSEYESMWQQAGLQTITMQDVPDTSQRVIVSGK